MKQIQYRIYDKKNSKSSDYKFEEVPNKISLREFAKTYGFNDNERSFEHGIKYFDNKEQKLTLICWFNQE